MVRRGIILPVEVVLRYYGFRHIRRAVERAERQVFLRAVNVITEDGLIPD